ncbi:hypothetical protein DYB32_008407 [Aphanomyces invadans]|uniref:HTH CENPB-type domain-containing protein n=1 Tax=Aphanomyces invadans TaxID=157072 RepID=A0A418ALN3_9STRA|nr:hypothetical protein DYB32_008407 [Aphanomyces invadans]
MELRMTLVEKHELYANHLSEPNVSNSALALWAAQTFGLALTLSKSTVAHVLKSYSPPSLRADKAKRTKEQRVALPEVEVKLVEAVLRCEELGVCTTGDLIRQQARTICGELGVETNPRISKGWLYKFQRRNGLTNKVQHGEAGSFPLEAVDVGRREVLSMTSGYSTGTDTIDPLFIGTAAKHRCFGGQTPAELGLDYYASMKGWMNSDIFNSYLEALNVKMAEQGQKALMLVDNVPPHLLFEATPLSNIRVKKLPPNMTAYLQPQDTEVIAAFKAKIKHRQLQNALEQVNEAVAGRQDRLYEVLFDVAMGWAKEAWWSTTQSTVTNGWARIGIMDDHLTTFSGRLPNFEINIRE